MRMNLYPPLRTWAGRNPVQARVLLGVFFAFNSLLAAAAGMLLSLNGFHIPALFTFLCLPLLLLLYIRYDRMQTRMGYLPGRWVRGRWFAGATLLILGLAFGSANRIHEWSAPPSGTWELRLAAVHPVQPEKPQVKQSPVQKWIHKQVLRVRLFFAELTSGISPAAWILLMVLAAAACVFIGFLCFIVGCNLSCSGNQAAGTVVTVLGLVFWVGAIFLIGYGIYKCIVEYNRRHPRAEEVPAETPAESPSGS